MLLIQDQNAEVGSRGFRGIRRWYMRNGKLDVRGFKNDWNKSSAYINSALSDFEALFGVMGKRYLPFSPMVVTYAGILHYFQEVKHYAHDKEKRIRQKLKKWYWVSVIGQRYKAGTNSVIRKDYQLLKDWIAPGAHKTPSRFMPKMTEEEIERLIGRTRSGADAVYRAVVCLPHLKQKCDIYSGQPYCSSPLDDHHIYPRKRLRDSGCDEDDINQVSNRVLTCKRAHWPLRCDWPWKHFKTVSRQLLRGYYIPEDIVEGKPRFREFIRYRRASLAKRVASLVKNGV